MICKVGIVDFEIVEVSHGFNPTWSGTTKAGLVTRLVWQEETQDFLKRLMLGDDKEVDVEAEE